MSSVDRPVRARSISRCSAPTSRRRSCPKRVTSRCAVPAHARQARDHRSPVRIDIAGIDSAHSRARACPPATTLAGRRPGRDVFYLDQRRDGAAGALRLHRYQLRERTAAPFSKAFAPITLSGDGKKLLYRARRRSAGASSRPIVRRRWATARSTSRSSGCVGRSARRVGADLPGDVAHSARVLLRREDARRQLAGGVDKYSPLVPFVGAPRRPRLPHRDGRRRAHRRPLVSAGAGDEPETDPVSVGMLGADYAIENGRYRIQRIYSRRELESRAAARRSARPACRSPKATICSR